MTRPKVHRLVTGAFGLLFVALAIAILAVSERTAGPLVAAAGVGFLGIDALVSAFRGKPSALSRIGPLP